MTFAEQLRLTLIQKNLTMRDVSNTLNIPYRTIQDWKAGRKNPPEWLQPILLREIERIEK